MAFAPPVPSAANLGGSGVGDYASRVVAWTIVLAIVYTILKGSAAKYLSYLGIGPGAPSIPLSSYGQPTGIVGASSSGGGGGGGGASTAATAEQAAEVAAMVLL